MIVRGEVMKKIMKIFLYFTIIVILATTFVLVYPNLYKKHVINDLNLTFKCPIYYEQTEANEENIILKSSRNGIEISIYKFEKDFLSPVGTIEKLRDYDGLLETLNYDCVLENTKSEIVEVSQKVCGMYTTEIKSLKQLNKEKTLIIPMKEYDLIFSIHGLKDKMVEYEKQVEKILNSIKIK